MYVSLFCCWALEQLLQCKSFFTLPKALPTSSTSFFISTLHSCCSGSGFPVGKGETISPRAQGFLQPKKAKELCLVLIILMHWLQ